MTSYAVDVHGRQLVLFFSGRSEYSNHFLCDFVDDDGRRYSSSEQYYMRMKALYFGDFKAADEIMKVSNPGKQKQIGKRVNGFHQDVWNGVSRQVMYMGLTMKFSQNATLKRALLDSGDAILVECSPFDRRWGVGLDASDPDVRDQKKWKGSNWLGYILMRVRSEIKEESTREPPTTNVDHFPPIVPSPLVAVSPISRSCEKIINGHSPINKPLFPPTYSSLFSFSSSPGHGRMKNDPGKALPVTPSSSPPIVSPDRVKSATLWNAANDPVCKVEREVVLSRKVLSPVKTIKIKKPETKSISKSPPVLPTPTSIPPLSLSSSPLALSNVPEKVPSTPQRTHLSVPSSPATGTKKKPIKGEATEIKREERRARLAVFRPMTYGWMLHLEIVAIKNNYSLAKMMAEEFPGVSIDRRKVSDRIKKIKNEEIRIIQNKGDITKFCNTPLVLSSLCNSSTIVSLKSAIISAPPSSPNLVPVLSVSPPQTISVSFSSPVSPAISSHSSSHFDQTTPSSGTPPFPINPIRKMHQAYPPDTHNSLPQTPVSRPATAGVIRSRLNQSVKRLTISRDSHKSIASLRLQEKKSVETELRQLSSKFALQENKLNKVADDLTKAKSELAATKKELRTSNKRVCIREEEVEMFKAVPKGLGGSLITMEGGQYTAACVKTILELKTCGVSDRNVGPVMDKVYKSAGISLSHIPSKSTVGRTTFVAKALTNKQTHSVLSDQINRQQSGQLSGMCMLSDETTKWQHKIQGYSITMINEKGEKINHVIGLKAVASKDAETSLDTVMEILDEIDNSGAATPTHSRVAGRFRDLVISYVNSVMGDRASTQVKFGNIFQDYRKKIFPKVRNGWDSMSAREKFLHNIFISAPCFVHILASLTEPVIEAIAQHQIILTGIKDLPLNNPSVLVLLKQLTKHFGPRSSGKYSTYKNYIAWCASLRIKPIRLPSLKGNRFNVVPAAAARIYAYRAHFLEFTHLFPTDDLKVIRQGLSDPLMNSQILVLALIDVYVTGPLWRISKGDISITETPKFIGELLEWVEAREKTPNLLFQGGTPQLSVPTNVCAFRLNDKMVQLLVTRKPTKLCLEAAQVSMNAIAGFIRRVFAPFLPGGQYYTLLTATGPIAERAHAAIAATAANNVPSESIFGLADWLLNRAPRSRISRIGTEVLMRKNHTMTWLEAHSDEAQVKIIRECMKMGPILEQQAKADSQKVTEKVCAKMKELAANDKAKRTHEQKVADELTTQLLEYGFFYSEDDLDKFMAKELGHVVTRNVLSLQLKFRKKVICQPTFQASCFTVNPRSNQFSMAALANKVRLAIKKDKKIAVNIFCGLDVATDIIGQYEHIEYGQSYPCAIIACRKVAQGGPSYALIKYLCGSEKYFIMREDIFRWTVHSGGFKRLNAQV